MVQFYPHLFEEGKIGSLRLKNRIVMSPMHTMFVEGSEPRFTQRYTDYYKERAKGGVGLIITCHVKAERDIDPYPLTFTFPCIDTERSIRDFYQVTESVHRYGAKIAIELSAGTGRLADAALPSKWPAAPSRQPLLFISNLNTRELTKREIAGLVEAYGNAANLAKQAEFDAIYIHSLAYLLDQFLSSCWNQRTDEYGGSLENRMRFMLECIESARSKVGNNFPMLVGMACEHGFEKGRKLEETIQIAKKLQDIGVDALHLRLGCYDMMHHLIPTAYMGDAVAVAKAELVKKAVDMPVIVDGNLGDPDLCESLLAQNKIDFVGLARPLLADPEWPKKVQAGKKEDILPCIRCQVCLSRIFEGKYATCSVNPRLGNEGEPIMPTQAPKRVLVVGGGPAGMEAARVAASRGHKVTLIEKGPKLGGHLLESSIPAFKKEIAAYLRWLTKQVEAVGVQTETDTEATAELVKQREPDVVILCTGSVPFIPDVPGVDKPSIIIAKDALEKSAKVGSKVIVVGGGLVGCETALYLTGSGRSVKIIEMLPDIAIDVPVMARFSLLEKLREAGVSWTASLKFKEVTDNKIIAEDARGNQQSLDADSIILAAGLVPQNGLYKALLGYVKEVYQVGDCVRPRKIIDAVHEAYLISKDI